MKIEIGENNCLLVLLEKEEADAFALNAQTITYKEPAVRHALAAVYREAALQAGFVPQTYISRSIEVLPFENGNILLCFSFNTKKEKLKIQVRRKREKAVYQFFSKESFAAFTAHASHLQQLPEGVYEQDGTYRFIISPRSHALEKMLGEYAEKITQPFAQQYTREYWREVYRQ